MYLLYLEVDPSRIDINVHPTKQEIKFEDERLIYNYLRVSIRHALGKYSITPRLDFEQETAFNGPAGGESNILTPHPIPGRSPIRDEENLRNWHALYEGLSPVSPAPSSFETLIPEALQDDVSALETLQIHGIYVVAQVKSGMLLVDQQAAHQRILYERYLSSIQNDAGGVQKLLFPETIELSIIEARVLADILPEIHKMGFDVQEFGGNSFVIHGVPAMLSDQNGAEVLRHLITEYIEDVADGLGLQERVARAMSLSSALKPGMRIAAEERLHLIENLFACENPYMSPAGKRCFVVMSMEEIFSRLSKT
jgi:DNA mismatch repair protein MutL